MVNHHQQTPEEERHHHHHRRGQSSDLPFAIAETTIVRGCRIFRSARSPPLMDDDVDDDNTGHGNGVDLPVMVVANGGHHHSHNRSPVAVLIATNSPVPETKTMNDVVGQTATPSPQPLTPPQDELIKYRQLDSSAPTTTNGRIGNGFHHNNNGDDRPANGHHHDDHSLSYEKQINHHNDDNDIVSSSGTSSESSSSMPEPQQQSPTSTSLSGGGSQDQDQDQQYCLLCSCRFDISRHRRLRCQNCLLPICFPCSLFDDDDQSWICIVCHQQRSISNPYRSKCPSWLCKRVVTSVRERDMLHFSNAKLRLSHHHRTLRQHNSSSSPSPSPSLTPNITNNNSHNHHHHHHHHHHHNNLNGNSKNNNSIGNQHDDDQRKTVNGTDDGGSLNAEVVVAQFPVAEIDDNDDDNRIVDDDDDDDARHGLERFLARLLGLQDCDDAEQSLDYCHIGPIFQDEQYYELIRTYTPILVELLAAALRQRTSSTSNNGGDSDVTPIDDQLRECLNEIGQKSLDLAGSAIQLRINRLRAEDLERLFLVEDGQPSSSSSSSCSTTYEHLLATAIVNQIIEVGQSRFMTLSNNNNNNNNSGNPVLSSSNNHPAGHHQHRTVESSMTHNKMDVFDSPHHRADDAGGDDHSCDRPICIVASSDEEENGARKTNNSNKRKNVSVEDKEVIDQSDHGHDDDDDDEEEVEDDDDDLGFELNFEQSKVYFPEAGRDLIDATDGGADDLPTVSPNVIKLLITGQHHGQSWQDNWMFRKQPGRGGPAHRDHLRDDLLYRYMALAMFERVPMLIPNPSQPCHPMLVGELPVADVSELSEHNSETGSIIFSDDDDNDDDVVDAIGDQNNNNETASSSLAAATASAPDNKCSKAATSTVYIENRRNNKRDSLQSALADKNKTVNRWRRRWSKIKVPDFVPNDLRTICSSIPNPHVEDLDDVPSLTLKPGNATIHSGIVAQFCCRATGLMPLYFAWYKDGQLIAASDDNRTRHEIEPNVVTQTYFGLRRYQHRRYVESSCTAYRLIVINHNECILELKKSSPIHSGVYSVVAYNHSGHDWCDFRLTVDRTHYSTLVKRTALVSNGSNHHHHHPTMSPRPVLRRPHKRKQIQQQQRKSIEEDPPMVTSELVTRIGPCSGNDSPGDQRKHDSPSVTVIQQTWQEREAAAAAETKNQKSNSLTVPIGHGALPRPDSAQLVALDTIISGDGVPTSNCGDQTNKSSCQIIAAADMVHSRTYDDNGHLATEDYDETVMMKMVMAKIGDDNFEPRTPSSSLPPVISTAERERRKWENPDVYLENNPYSPENIEQRALRMHSPELFSMNSGDSGSGTNAANDDVEEEFVPEEKRKYFHSNRDLNRFKRDYYVPKNVRQDDETNKNSFSILNSLGRTTMVTPTGSAGTNSPVKNTSSYSSVTVFQQDPQSVSLELLPIMDRKSKEVPTVEEATVDYLDSMENLRRASPAATIKKQTPGRPSVKNMKLLFGESSTARPISPAQPERPSQLPPSPTVSLHTNNTCPKMYSLTGRDMSMRTKEFYAAIKSTTPDPNRIGLANELAKMDIVRCPSPSQQHQDNGGRKSPVQQRPKSPTMVPNGAANIIKKRADFWEKQIADGHQHQTQ